MIGLDLLLILEDGIYKMPYPLLLGVVGASILASLPWLFLAMGNWISDLGRYGSIFPFFWISSGIILLISKSVDNVNVCDDYKGWMKYLILFGVTTFMSLIFYLTFFLVFCFLEVVSHHFKWFVCTWVITFLLIAISISGWIYYKGGGGGNGNNLSWSSSQNSSSCNVEDTTNASDGSWLFGFGGSSVKKCPKTPVKFD